MIPDYSRIPETIGAIRRYIDQGLPPGDFLYAVLSNDLREAFGRADENNCREMFHIVAYLYNEAPRVCWGNVERVKEWLRIKEEARIKFRKAELKLAQKERSEDGEKERTV